MKFSLLPSRTYGLKLLLTAGFMLFTSAFVVAQTSVDSVGVFHFDKSGTNTLPEPGPESMPEYPGGDIALLEFIQANTPPCDSSGVVVVGFIVTETGQLSAQNIVRGLTTSCNIAALELLDKLKPFIPAKYQGNNTSALMNLPIVFRKKQ